MSSKSVIRHWTPDDGPQDLSNALFGGALVVFRQLPSLEDLGERVRTTLAATFAVKDLLRVEGRLSASAFQRLALLARRRVANDERVASLWQATLATVGFGVDAMWLDRIRLRVVPSRRDIDHRRLQVLAPHRDTWGSGIAAQVNWWLPLYPLADTRTMLVWPHLFRRPIANDSAAWSFEAARNGGVLLPTAQVEPSGASVPIRLEPGQLLAFSAAHLHGGVADASGLTRFSIDTRTVWEADRLAGRGAPNVDGPAATPDRQMWRWFSPLERRVA